MIIFIYGNDAQKRLQALDTLLKKYPEKEFSRMSLYTEEENTIGIIKEILFTPSMFAEKRCLMILESSDMLVEMCQEFLEVFKQSEHVFIFIEESQPKWLPQKSQNINIFECVSSLAPPTANVFDIAEAFGNRDKKRAWLVFQKLLSSGIDAQECLNILWWQAKTLLLVLNSKGNPGLKPFVYNKNLRYQKNFSEKEIIFYTKNILDIQHRARRGHNLENLLEQLLLSV